MTEAQWIDAKLRTLRIAGQRMFISAELAQAAFGSVDDAERSLRERHHSFMVYRLVGDELCLTKRACISRNRWL